MKRKIRTITINDKKYVWKYKLDLGIVISLSPFNDKTSVIIVNFPCSVGDGFPEYIYVSKDNESICLKTAEPKMISFIISYLTCDSFVSRKTIYYNGFDLLMQMGYTIDRIQEKYFM